MRDTDIVTRLREWSATICSLRNSSPEGSKSKLARDAAAEIETLRAERDEARREWCRATWLHGGVNPFVLAKDKGWDCFKEDKP